MDGVFAAELTTDIAGQPELQGFTKVGFEVLPEDTIAIIDKAVSNGKLTFNVLTASGIYTCWVPLGVCINAGI